jgi:rhodanese-related sulfurtransferase
MFESIKKIFIGNKVDFKDLLSNGAIILDVRTKEEFDRGNIKGSINMPLNNLMNTISNLDKNKPIITCCASGMRSSTAKSILKNSGFTTVENGGGWQSLQGKIQ